MGDTILGTAIRKLREIKGMSRRELSKTVGISESYLHKIETGIRQPGIQTYQKIASVLDSDIVIKSSEDSVKGDCAARVQKIFMESTDKEALFMVQVLECMAQNIGTVK